MVRTAIEIEFIRAIRAQDTIKIRGLYAEYPELHHSNIAGNSNEETWLGVAASRGLLDSARELTSLGYDMNAIEVQGGDTPLILAISNDHESFVDYLLQLGADPNLGRPMLASMCSDLQPDRQLKYLKLLMKHGADVNRLYDLYGDKNNLFSALDFAPNEEVRQFLVSHGALPSSAIKSKIEQRKADSSQAKSKEELILEYFSENFGSVDPRSIIEIKPEGLPIKIHAVPPSKDRKLLTLFTTGMSEIAMRVSKGGNCIKYSELFIQLPADWDYKQLRDPACSWPIRWLKKLARYPGDNDCWLEHPTTLMSFDRKTTIAPNQRYNSFLLFAEREISIGGNEFIHLCRVFPLYPEEEALCKTKGVGELMKALDKNNIPVFVSPGRKNVGESL